MVSTGSGATPPAVPVLVDPTNGQSFFLGSVQPLSATTTDLDLDRIDFVLKTGVAETVIGSVSSAPFDTTWVVAGSLGFHQVIARAWRSGAHTDSLVATIELLPVYLITAPVNGFAAFIGEAVALGASTTEVVTRVDWILDPGTPGETIIDSDNTSPFTGSWSPVFLDVGTHTMVARFVTGITHVDSAPITVFVIQATLRNDTYFQNTVWSGPPKFYIDSNLGQVYARAWGAGGGGTIGIGAGDGGWYAGGQVTPAASETVVVGLLTPVNTDGVDTRFGSLLLAPGGLSGANNAGGGSPTPAVGTVTHAGGKGGTGAGVCSAGAGAGQDSAGLLIVPGEPDGGVGSSADGGLFGGGGSSNGASAFNGRPGQLRIAYKGVALNDAPLLVGFSSDRAPVDTLSKAIKPPTTGSLVAVDLTGLYQVMVVSADGTPNITVTGSVSGAWSSLPAITNGATLKTQLFFRKVGVPETVTVAVDVLEQFVVEWWAFSNCGAGDPQWGTTFGTSNLANPPSFSPVGGNGTWYWVAGCGVSGAQKPSLNGTPSNYSNIILQPPATTACPMLVTAERVIEAANQDPNGFGLLTSTGGAINAPWTSFVFVVPPTVITGGAGPTQAVVAAWGNSTTSQANSYRNMLWQRGQASATTRIGYLPIGTVGLVVDPPCDDPNNGGFGGETIELITVRVNAFAGAQPTHVVSMVGTPNVTAGQSAATILGHMDAHIDALKAKHTVAAAANQIYIVAIQYGNGSIPSMTAAGIAGDVNAALPALCASKGVNYVDIYSGPTPFNPAIHAVDGTGTQNTQGGFQVGNTLADQFGI